MNLNRRPDHYVRQLSVKFRHVSMQSNSAASQFVRHERARCQKRRRTCQPVTRTALAFLQVPTRVNGRVWLEVLKRGGSGGRGDSIWFDSSPRTSVFSAFPDDGQLAMSGTES